MATSVPHETGPQSDANSAGTGGHGEFVLAGPTHDIGYEPDTFSVKTILVVPIAVLSTAAIVFIGTWILFTYIFDPKIEYAPPDNPEAAARDAEPLNERLGRISSTDANAEVQQPRLEGLEERKVFKPDPNSGYTLTPEITTTTATSKGNSPRYHADDLRPNRIEALSTAGPNRIPVEDAMAELVNGKLLRAREGAQPLDVHLKWDRPKESNGGNTQSLETAKPAAAKKEPEKKGPQGKGGEPEKK